ncbi:multiple inositol polyphosphate phosphatase 1-like [Gigantopelta aegis]|uniref:multiple inositol polyphosphate phosphatase 1-like n=1 Tax=Gigantopelta aegis TaxID=1735272 RepID=UPI001B88DDA6|nr:multiple inositol polyphosphate phosphatase 1-like [Gigantopelta aegis]
MLNLYVLFVRVFIACSIVVHSLNAFSNFATKTSYDSIHNPDDLGVEDEFNSVDVNKLTCQAAHASALIRHGTRFPGQNDVHEISEIHKVMKDHLDELKFETLTKWTNHFPNNNEKTLMDMGEDEQFHLGRRMAHRLKSLFVDENIDDDFRFSVSSKQRSQDSARAFFEGFTEVLTGEASDDIDPELSDETLRFHERCHKFIITVDRNETALHEYKKFKQSKLIQNILSKIVSKYALPPDVLSAGNIRTMYIICAYEMALFKKSPWCDMFDEEDAKVIEYLSDLKHYYKNGYGYDIIREQSCPLVADMFGIMDDAISALEEPLEDSDEDTAAYTLGNFYFGHAETIGPLYAALGLFNDSEPLRADNYDKHHNRLFRTSNIIPFSANLMFVLYECEPQISDTEDDTAEYMLKLFVNEKVQKIPGCDGDICPYEYVRKRYEKYIDDCNFRKTCAVGYKVKDEL